MSYEDPSYGDLVPAPRSQAAHGGGEFVFRPDTPLDAGPGTEGAARWLRATLTPATGLALPPGEGGLTLRTDEGDGGDGGVAAELGPEGYVLESSADALRITGGGPAGVFWGVQTLRQLLGPDAFRRAPLRPGDGVRRVPGLRIADAPRFAWRGHLLDVARHFMPKDGVLRTIDLLAAHKLNVLHLHLTDDQGWRVEIERAPRLTEVGGVRARTRVGRGELWDERAHGGCYSRDDLREIVAYAAERHVTVVPEIDIPGHSQAAIAAYPELGNVDAVDTTSLGAWTDWGVSPNVLAPAEHVLRFYEGVLEEVLEIFPSRFVHVGGDECPTEQWRASAQARARVRDLGLPGVEALPRWFMRHFARWLAERGRRLVGWDEILDGGGDGEGGTGGSGLAVLPPDAAISSWRGPEGGVAAARAGHDVVMCPEQEVYLDHRQAPGEEEPVPLGFVRTLRDVYAYEPVPEELAGTDAAARVLGVQANMWTECAENAQRVDYQTYPRLSALAEVAWSPRSARDVADFEARLTRTHYDRLTALGVAFRPPAGPLPWQRRPGVTGRPRA